MRPGTLEIWWSNAILLVGVLIILFGFGVLGYQALLWLEHGSWEPLELRLLWQWLNDPKPAPEPAFSWQGVQIIALWILESPLSVGMIVLGFGTALTGMIMAGRAYADREETERMYRKPRL